MHKRLAYLGMGLALLVSGCSNVDPDVILLTPDALRISTQPTSGATNAVLPKLQTEFINNSQLLAYQGPVSLNLSTNPTGATLGGTTFGTSAPTGVLDFNDLSINKKGVYQITASSPDLADVISQPITIGGGAVNMVKTATLDMPGVTESYEIESADLNNDGNLDLVTANYSDQRASVFLGDGQGGFATPLVFNATGYYVDDLILRDFNRDGKVDLAFASSNSDNLVIALGQGNGTFNTPTAFTGGGSGSFGIAAGDLNNDGFEDLVMANRTSSNASVFLGDGSGSFTLQPLLASSTASANYNYPVVTDFNQDGKMDIAINDFNNNLVDVFLGNGDGTFAAPTSLTAQSQPFGVDTADFNNDGRPDLVVANAGSDSVSVFLNTGSGFSSASNFAVGDDHIMVVAADLNLDGNIDLLVTNEHDNSVSLLLGNGDGSFQTASNIATSASAPWGINVADFNKDSVPDFVVNLSNTYKVDVFLQTP